jgi:hypothetical protein
MDFQRIGLIQNKICFCNKVIEENKPNYFKYLGYCKILKTEIKKTLLKFINYNTYSNVSSNPRAENQIGPETSRNFYNRPRSCVLTQNKK